MVTNLLNAIDDVMYYPVLIIVMTLFGLYFTFRMRGVQIRLLPEAIRCVMEPPEGENVSSFQALMVSTASRVGTGNIIGVSTAICLGGPGACFWMWLMCIIGGASAFTESTLAQIYKRRGKDGNFFGGPAYYIEQALHAPQVAVIFCIFLIATYAFGFNLLCSYNLQSTFAVYPFYHKESTPMIIGVILAVIVGYCLMGGGRRIISLTSTIVPFMGVSYVAVALIIILLHFRNIPAMFAEIFANAFDFKAIFGGISGSCMIYGIKRGLYSNEAGVGSAPNAAAAAHVSHPVKQGLVQTLSVYIDTLLLCTATALMCLASGTPISAEVSGAPYVQNAISTVFGEAGPIFITIAMILFAFTTLIGNLYYVDNALAFLNGKKMPGKRFMQIFHIICMLVVFLGAIAPMDACWALADITMGLMTFINLPCCFLMSGTAAKALKDYECKKREGLNPVFKAREIGIEGSQLDCWK